MRSLPRWSLALLAVVTVAGAILRFDAASHPSAYQSRDERSYARIARALVVNHTYGAYGRDGQKDPVHWLPGAPVLFALAYAIDDERRDDGVWDVPSAYPWQAGIGTATILATFALALVIAGPAAGVVAAAAVAFYPPLISASGDLLSEPLGSLLLTAGMAATIVTLRRRSPLVSAAAGALLAATVLTRGDLTLVPLIALVAVAVAGWRGAARGRALGAARVALPMLIALAVLLTPWTVFASGVAGRFVPLSSGGASNLWVGTYLPGQGSIFGSKRAMEAEVKRYLPRLADRRAFQIPQEDVIATVAARRPGLEPEAALRAEALENLREYGLGRPGAFAGMLASKVWRLWGDYTRGTYRQARGWLRAVHLLIVAVGFAGLLAGMAVRRRPELWLIAAVLVYLSALNAVLVSEARHNLAAMPLVIAGGVAGGALALGRVRAAALRRRRAAAQDVPFGLLDAGGGPSRRAGEDAYRADAPATAQRRL